MTDENKPNQETLFGAIAPEDVSDEAIIAELERELSLRRRVYPRWVTAGKLEADTAQRRILLFEAAIARFRFLTAVARPEFF